jgi:predicted LPLAT superfamily acyltransferase
MLYLREGEFMSARRHSSTAAIIRRMAEQHHVAYAQTEKDELARHMTRLAGDDVELDEVEQMLIALQRAGHLSRVELVRLQASYLREAKL